MAKSTSLLPTLAWSTSISSTLGFMLLIVLMWVQIGTQSVPEPNQLVSTSKAVSEINVMLQSSGARSGERRFRPTGVFLQSIDFASANEVYVTGYIWQRYFCEHTGDEAGEAGCPTGELETPGFILPESVKASTAVLLYEDKNEDFAVYGWYIEATLRQSFQYEKFPFDKQEVWIRMWPDNIGHDVILIPDLESYERIAPGVAFGLDSELVLDDWDVADTFFEYKNITYDTNFGLMGHPVNPRYPELYFNVVLQRRFLNVLILHIVPIMTVCGLLFAILLTLTHRKRDVSGFNVSNVVALISALFFVVLLAHVNVRSSIRAGTVVYIEYYYILMYVLMIGVTINAFMVASDRVSMFNIAQYHDNLLPKLMFWPFTLGSVALFTYLVLL